jgi:hypothetical protein
VGELAQPLDVKRLLATGRKITDNGRSQARQFGTDLAEQGRQTSEQITTAISELVQRSTRERNEELRQTVRTEVQTQLRVFRHEVNGLLDAQRERRSAEGEALRTVVREEVQRQFASLGLATRDDLAALARTIRNDVADAIRSTEHASDPTAYEL